MRIGPFGRESGQPGRIDSPHIARLRQRRDGPYYVAPDSVEPLPNDMWSNLTVEGVEKELDRFPVAEWPDDPDEAKTFTRSAVPKPQREFLESGGDAAKILLQELDKGL